MKFLAIVDEDVNRSTIKIGSEAYIVLDDETISICPVCNTSEGKPYETEEESIIYTCLNCPFIGIGQRPIIRCSYEEALEEFYEHKDLIYEYREKMFFVSYITYIERAIPADKTYIFVEGTREYINLSEKLFDQIYEEHGIKVSSFDISTLFDDNMDIYEYYYMDREYEMHVLSSH